MKKLITLAAAVVSAALFFGCSDSSDNNNAAFLLAASGSSLSNSSNTGLSGVSLPESVGINELKGKCFTSDNIMGNATVMKFSENSVSIEIRAEFAEEANINSACKYESTTTYSYSYNYETKRLYWLPVSESAVIIRGDNKTALAKPTFTTDAEFFNGSKAYYKSFYDKATDAFLESLVKQDRSKFDSFGYTDSTHESTVSKEIIARYNRAQSLKQIVSYAYNLSSDGVTLKLLLDSTYFAPGTSLADVYSPAYAKSTFNIVNDLTTVYTLNYARQYIWPERDAAIMSLGTFPYVGHKVSSINSNVINLSESGIRTSTDEDFDYDPAFFNFVYEATDITNGVKYTLKNSLTNTTMGEITINYATSSNIPDMTSVTTYTLVTE